MSCVPGTPSKGFSEGFDDSFEAQLIRTVDQLRAMPLDRLARTDAEGISVAQRAHRLATNLLQLTNELQPGVADEILPALDAHEAGDQVAVIGNELLTAIARVSSSESKEMLVRAATMCRLSRQQL